MQQASHVSGDTRSQSPRLLLMSPLHQVLQQKTFWKPLQVGPGARRGGPTPPRSSPQSCHLTGPESGEIWDLHSLPAQGLVSICYKFSMLVKGAGGGQSLNPEPWPDPARPNQTALTEAPLPQLMAKSLTCRSLLSSSRAGLAVGGVQRRGDFICSGSEQNI